VLVGVLYPLAMTGVAQVAFRDRANGSIVEVDGRPVGSSLIGQHFVLEDGSPDARYFQSRPSAAGEGYDAMSSGGTNDGPSSDTLLDDVARRVKDYRDFNGLAAVARVPVDAVTASASGLDPDISVANARLQAARVAEARDLPVEKVLDLVAGHTNDRPLGFLGEKTVKVLDLNLALDQVRTR
jgi:K+-transporting ATPase ATPase C chain